MSNILIVDDERAIRNTLRDILEYEKLQVEEAADGNEGWEKIRKGKHELILCDIKMPGMDGMELLVKMQEAGIETPIIMISGHGNIETAVEAVKKGAYDFIQKPLDLNRLLVTLRNAMDRKQLIQETRVLRKKVAKTVDMVGESAAIKGIQEIIEKVAPTDARVLITGPNGSGKELVARWIHEKSQRSSGPLVEVNCAAIPSELIESELFGHEKGAFTSAVATRKGRFEQAEGGTLFLDEVGDMSLSAQAKVLRALQENKIVKVGGEKEQKINVRVIAATNKNLQHEIAEGRFREDLFHRLNVIPIRVPALAERRDDIPLLVGHFLTMLAQEQGITPKTMAKDALAALQEKPWTGNIRELRNVVERLMILSGKTITAKDVSLYC
jgi:hypothetical protein